MAYKTLITDIGHQNITAAAAGGTTVNLTQFKAGDANGNPYEPTGAETDLVNVVYSASLNSRYVDSSDNTILILEHIIPASSGPYVIREVGIYDDAGALIAIANFPDTTKPDPSSGAGKDIKVQLKIRTLNVSSVTLSIDSSAVYATVEYVDTVTNDLDSRLAQEPSDWNSTNISPHAAATLAKIQELIAALVDSSPATLDTLNELAAALGDDPDFATTVTNAIAAKQNLSEKDQASGYAGLDASALISISELPFIIGKLDDGTVLYGKWLSGTINNGSLYANISHGITNAYTNNRIKGAIVHLIETPQLTVVQNSHSSSSVIPSFSKHTDTSFFIYRGSTSGSYPVNALVLFTQ